MVSANMNSFSDNPVRHPLEMSDACWIAKCDFAELTWPVQVSGDSFMVSLKKRQLPTPY